MTQRPTNAGTGSARGAGTARAVRLWHPGTQSRRDPLAQSGRRRRLLRDRRDPRSEAAGRCQPRRAQQPDRRCRIGRQRCRPRAQGSDRFQHRRRQLLGLRPAHPPPHSGNGNGAGRDGPVHAAPGADDPRHSRHLLRQCERSVRSAGRLFTPLTTLSPSCTLHPKPPRPSGSPAPTVPGSPPATTSAPAACWRCRRSTISARARPAR